MTDLTNRAADALTRLEKLGRRRRLTQVTRFDGPYVERDGHRLLNFSSNNYLGLAHHPDLISRSQQALEDWGAGSTASRLVCGDMALFRQVERKLAKAKGKQAALIFNSGFQANSSILPALLDKDLWGSDPLVFTDRYNHASMHQGVATSGLRQIRFRHNDMDHLAQLLEKHRGSDQAKLIITETVFSMDGDRADLDSLAQLAKDFHATLFVDEAHATGVLGPTGFGLAEGRNDVPLVMGTFSKGLGGFGAYIAADQPVIDYLITRCAGFIYTTALPPAVLGAMDAAIDLVPSLTEHRAHLHREAAKTRVAFTEAGLDCCGSSTQIIPVVFGDESTTLAAMTHLTDVGILGIAIRPPTVPAGASRIRLALSALHSKDQCDQLRSSVIDVAKIVGVI